MSVRLQPMSMTDEARAQPRDKKPKKPARAANRPAKRRPVGERFITPPGERFAEPPTAPRRDLTDNIIIIAASAVLAACVIILGIYIFQVIEQKKNHSDIKNLYESAAAGSPERTLNVIAPDEMPAAVIPADDVQGDAAPADGEDGGAAADEGYSAPAVRRPLIILPAAAALLAENSDTAGYVRIPGVLEEAVVQCDDNDYYLKHNFYDKQRQCGTVFADHRNIVNDYPDLMSDNIVLYGHNEKDGSMFGNMDYYRWDPAFWQSHPFIYFNTNYEEGVYVIVSSFVTNAYPEDDNGNIFDYWNCLEFKDSASYDYFAGEITARSRFITGVDIRQGDKFITLSTCSTEWEDSRHAIVARKLRPGETEEDIDTSAFTLNPAPKWPAIYYKINGLSYPDGNN